MAVDPQVTHTIGRRKEAVCRVYVRPGSGKWDVNGRTLGDYFPPRDVARSTALTFGSRREGRPVRRLRDDVRRRRGGRGRGHRHGISRALLNVDPALRPPLKRAGLLTRDSREVGKKPGQPGARKKFQFSKR